MDHCRTTRPQTAFGQNGSPLELLPTLVLLLQLGEKLLLLLEEGDWLEVGLEYRAFIKSKDEKSNKNGLHTIDLFLGT
jgi:hypothetical protein